MVIIRLKKTSNYIPRRRYSKHTINKLKYWMSEGEYLPIDSNFRTIIDYQKIIERLLDIKWIEIQSYDRRREIVDNRHLAVYLLRSLSMRRVGKANKSLFPYEMIGRATNHNHATAIHSVKEMRAKAKIYPAFRNKIVKYLNKIMAYD